MDRNCLDDEDVICKLATSIQLDKDLLIFDRVNRALYKGI